ncbi:HAD family hydrolase [Clostridium sp.]|jgi:putative hydrolase of the HAD superfamily|uniref:HAD family hydrolase n=1 Tax=Clostridium sp. TaxID=1506 RepID=UPI0025880A6B|nr:HAD family hydrolase [Clostridium sp.]MDF2502669.1 putative superfamily hydrolase [Clostridium sp.]
MKEIKDSNKIIFFDIGGTLVGAPNLFSYIAEKYEDSRKDDIAKVISQNYNEMYSTTNENEFLSVKQMLEMTLKKVALEFGVKDLSDSAHAYYEELYTNQCYLYDDVISVLNILKDHEIKLIVFSNSDSDVLIDELKTLNIYHYFSEFIISNDVKSYKPCNGIVNRALEHCGDIPKENIFFVGNSDEDVLSAQKMNITSVLIKRWDKNINVQSDYTIDSLQELLKIVSI